MKDATSEKIYADIEKNYVHLQKVLANCFDIVLRRVVDLEGRKALVVLSDGLVNKEFVQEDIIRPLLGYAFEVDGLRIKNLDDIQSRLVSAVDVKQEPDFDKALLQCLSGDTLVFVDGSSECLVIQTRGWATRGISQPGTQQSVRGPKEGFTETLLLNVAMLRRKIRTAALKTEIMRIGELTKTDVCIAYIEGVAKQQLIEEVKSRLKKVDVQYILESGHIEQLIEDDGKTLFSTISNNEKPDVVAGKLIKGRVAVLVDGTPFVLTMPMVFTENFQAAEDYYSRPYYTNFLRILRLFAYIVTLTLPALYVALVTYHQEMIPDQMLTTLIEASQGVPMSSSLEMFIMLILYELLREALLRLPVQIGSTVGIVGVLIIGDAAVSANLLGAPTVVIAAMTFITSAVVNTTADSAAIIRILLLALGSAFGAFGVFIGIFLLLVHLCTLKSFGYPYMLPLAPFKFRGIKDSIVRVSMKEILKRDGF